MKRRIINIDENKCNGCGLCIPDCPEGALQIVDGKARLISDLFCDSLGACMGTCPEGAITVIEREAEEYDEAKVMANIVSQGTPVIQVHLEHLIEHRETRLYNEAIEYLNKNNIKIPQHESKAGHANTDQDHNSDVSCCPGSMAMTIEREHTSKQNEKQTENIISELRQWPVQLKLLNPAASYFNNADLLIAADCVPFAYGDFHRNFLQNKIVIMFCPKLDPYIDEYIEKMTAILSNHNINSITVLHMEVPCCSGVNYVLDQALENSGKEMPVKEYTVSIKGDVA